jgi:hypothetical protein
MSCPAEEHCRKQRTLELSDEAIDHTGTWRGSLLLPLLELQALHG